MHSHKGNPTPTLPCRQGRGRKRLPRSPWRKPTPPLFSLPCKAGEGAEAAKRAFDEAILERLVALNAERAAEDARGLVRWMRPGFQNPQARPADAPAPEQGTFEAGTDDTSDDSAAAAPIASKPQPWPKDTVEQVRAVADLLAASPAPLTLDAIGERFSARGPWKKRLPQLLDMLVALGRAELRADGRYGAAR